MFLFETILKYIEVTFLETKYAAWYVQGTIKILFNELYTFLIEKDLILWGVTRLLQVPSSQQEVGLLAGCVWLTSQYFNSKCEKYKVAFIEPKT